LTALLKTSRKETWPPTEILLNFSLDAVRRIGGQVRSPKGQEASLERLDETLGSASWRDHFAAGVSDEAVAAVVTAFAVRLRDDTGMQLISVPVKRAPTHKPVYHLIFGTRSQHGLWAFGDSVARATEAWWDTLEEVEAEHDPDALFGVAATVRPVLDTVERAALPVITDNLAALLDHLPAGFTTVDQTMAVFGDFYGQVREPVVRRAVKALYVQGRTASTGVGGKPRDIVVLPPPQPQQR
jgi:hypothetical protein